jgi:hypothetical protein
MWVILLSALHVPGDVFVYLQEHLTVFTAFTQVMWSPGVMDELQLIHNTGRQRLG